MDYKSVSRDIYTKYARDFQDFTKDYLKKHIMNDARQFVHIINGKKVLDLGSGPGRDSLFFRKNGLKPVCIDIAPGMVKLCREKGLEAYEMDLENLEFEDSSFDGVWAYTSLLHMPKSKFSFVLKRISRVLKEKGVFYLGMKEGDFEGWKESDKYGGIRRFFSLYQDNEIKEALSGEFDILNTSKISLGDAVFLNYLCRKSS
jgi:ubiquinone/menaquinone biosynthesis C-methylase UbiE